MKIKAYSQNNITAPSFGRIKRVECQGLYKKFPELGKKLVDAFQQNQNAMDFCKKYDVNIIFQATKDSMNAVRSSVCVFYDNVAKGKLKRFIDFLSDEKDNINLSSFANKYNVEAALKESTNSLIEMITPVNPNGSTKIYNGLLDSHLRYAEERMQKILDKRAEKLAQKLQKTKVKEIAQNNLAKNSQKLTDSINNLIDSSK